MLGVLGIVAPIFGIVALGYAARRAGWATEEGLRGLNDFVFLLATPALLFHAGATQGLGGAGAASLAFFSAVLLVYGAATLVGLRARAMPLPEAGLFALSCTFGNTVMVGIPLVLAAYGPGALGTLLGIVAMHSLVLLPVATAVAETGLAGRAPPWRVAGATLRAVARNPVILSVALGLAWWLLVPVAPPLPLRRFLEMLGAAGPPAALFCLGASLTGFDARRDWPDAALASALKLLALPALVWGMARLWGLGAAETAVVVTTAALPTGANAFILARRYATGADRSGATVLVSTVASVATLGAAVAWFRG